MKPNVVSTQGTNQYQQNGYVFLPKTPEQFGYDADGNLTQDGRWYYTWDAENRLTQVESLSSSPTASKRKVVWEYDGKGRRIRQTTYNGSSGSYVVTEDLKFVYDGWHCLAELNATNNSLVRSYTWGLDLSGSLGGAGGVGGLLMMNSGTNGTHFYAYDGNGNVVALVKATDGTVSQNCEYDPFGAIIRNTGLMADENSFRFSTKRHNDTCDIDLYEHRPYRADEGRFLSRDPIGEEGGVPLLAFAANNPVNRFDPQGESSLTYTSEGQSQRDPWYRALWTSWDSGRRTSSDAYAWQWVYNFWPNTGGICNTGTRYLPHIGTFAQAWAKNEDCTSPATVKLRCTVVYVVVAVADSAVRIHAALAWHDGESKLLGHTLPTHSKLEDTTVMVLAVTETRTETITVAPRQKYELYNINPGVDGFKSTKGWFIENLFATCEELE